MNEVDIIRDARELLSDPAKWGKGSVSPTPESYCIAHALAVFNVRLGGTHTNLRAITDLIAQHTPRNMGCSIYNDLPETTHQDILNLLDKTLADLGGLA